MKGVKEGGRGEEPEKERGRRRRGRREEDINIMSNHKQIYEHY